MRLCLSVCVSVNQEVRKILCVCVLRAVCKCVRVRVLCVFVRLVCSMIVPLPSDRGHVSTVLTGASAFLMYSLSRHSLQLVP
eukprot:m.508 g.508  ORF g.508 m.508 type:complete len:82 (-) comp278_c0_seq1:11-256(-)